MYYHSDNDSRLMGWIKTAFEFVVFVGFILVLLAGYAMFVIAMEPV